MVDGLIILTFTTSIGCNLISSVSVTDASCNNTLDGSATLSVSNGNSPYSFVWDNGTTTQNLNGVVQEPILYK